jgi:hypothetical protein
MKKTKHKSYHRSTSAMWPLVIFSFIALLVYRLLNAKNGYFPVWVDEIIVKAFIFGVPSFAYALITREGAVGLGLSKRQFWPGALNGLAMGGFFGFVALVMSTFLKGHVLIPYVFASSQFWWQFFLAFMTAWWESLFFYGFILNALHAHYRDEVKSIQMTTLLFVIFHAPIILLSVGVGKAVLPLLLLSLFAFGQAVIFLRYRSLSTIVISHAFWGMALLVYAM